MSRPLSYSLRHVLEDSALSSRLTSIGETEAKKILALQNQWLARQIDALIRTYPFEARPRAASLAIAFLQKNNDRS